MNTVDLFFRCSNRAALAAALQPHGILIADLAGKQLAGASGWALDYIGPVVDVPAVLDTSAFPPVEITPAVMHPGERASLRLMGDNAQSRAAALVAAEWPEGVELLPFAEVPEAQRRWAGGVTPYTPATPELPAAPAEPTLAQRKAALRARLAERRWQRETGGTVVGGVPVRTDRESQAMLDGALSLASLSGLGSAFTTKWKGADGAFYTVTHAQLTQFALAVGLHAQASFAREAELAEQIDAAAADALPALASEIEAFELP